MTVIDELQTSLRRIESMLPAATIPTDMNQIEAAKALRVSRWTIARYVERGQLKKNRRGRITAESVRALLT